MQTSIISVGDNSIECVWMEFLKHTEYDILNRS